MARRIEISYFERRGNGLQPPRRFRYRRTIVRGAPAPRFTLQRLEKHPEPENPDRWVDVTATLEGVQAGGRLRPKP